MKSSQFELCSVLGGLRKALPHCRKPLHALTHDHVLVLAAVTGLAGGVHALVAVLHSTCAHMRG